MVAAPSPSRKSRQSWCEHEQLDQRPLSIGQCGVHSKGFRRCLEDPFSESTVHAHAAEPERLRNGGWTHALFAQLAQPVGWNRSGTAPASMSAAAGTLPPALASRFTLAEQAVLAVVALAIVVGSRSLATCPSLLKTCHDASPAFPSGPFTSGPVVIEAYGYSR